MRIKSQKKQMNSLSHISNKIITILDFWENQPPFFAVGSMIWLSSVEEVPGLGCSHKPRVSDHSVDLWIVDHIYCCLSKRFKLNICWLCCLKNHDDSIVIWYVMMWRFRVVFREIRNRYFEVSTCPFLQGCCSQESAPQHSALLGVEIGVKNRVSLRFQT